MPELDERTSKWLNWFSILNRTRPASMGGIAPINPVTALDLADRLQWPCDPEELLTVIIALDDQWRELSQPAKT